MVSRQTFANLLKKLEEEGIVSRKVIEKRASESQVQLDAEARAFLWKDTRHQVLHRAGVDLIDSARMDWIVQRV